MKVINYCNDGTGKAYSDLASMFAAYQLIDTVERIDTSTENVVYAVRVLVKENRLSDVVVEFNGELIGKIDQDGRIDNWPAGFCDTVEGFLASLFG